MPLQVKRKPGETGGLGTCGAFVLVKPGVSSMTDDALDKLCLQLKVPRALCPQYRGDYTAFVRAVRTGLQRLPSYKLDGRVKPKPGKRVATARIYKTGTLTAAEVRWEQVVGVQGAEEAVVLIAQEYGRLRGKILPEDWAVCTRRYLLEKCYAILIHNGMYWVPAAGMPQLTPYLSLLSEVGQLPLMFPGDMAVMEHYGQLGALMVSAAEHVQRELDGISNDMEGLPARCGEKRPSFYKNRKRRLKWLTSIFLQGELPWPLDTLEVFMGTVLALQAGIDTAYKRCCGEPELPTPPPLV